MTTPVLVCYLDASGNAVAITAANPLPAGLIATPTIDIGDVTLLAGTALVGKVGIDQTTPGTTNKVSIGTDGVVAATPSAATTGGYSYLNIVAGQATTVVKASAGTLHAIIFNGPATATNTTNVYDHASGAGTIIATPLATAVVGPVTVIFDIAFATGLTIITATANGANMTVVYK